MRINILQHAANEGPGAINLWAQQRHHDVFIYHPDQFGILPTANETAMLVILGGPMSPNDNLSWIKAERALIQELIKRDVPLFGACFGAQQIAKTLGSQIKKAPAKEVGWEPVTRQSSVIPQIPQELLALHGTKKCLKFRPKRNFYFPQRRLKTRAL